MPSRRAKMRAARIGPTVCELDGPMPIENRSKTEMATEDSSKRGWCGEGRGAPSAGGGPGAPRGARPGPVVRPGTAGAAPGRRFGPGTAAAVPDYRSSPGYSGCLSARAVTRAFSASAS
ncbi:hypothetical protein GCM10010238_55760 [Streptomyces griseoviridis]|uniref:Uncharacterized protein n=1 Tax=Streptomyces griseoviridis TaxID=45398 RepID=A0A918LK87_STRGD|nr:hypothetical protein GCM10010238_55760 [Streptomyces niveoruber]